MASRQMYEQFNIFFEFFCVKDNLTVGYQCQCSTMYPLYDLSAIFPLSCKCEWCTSVISPVRITLVAFKEKPGLLETTQPCNSALIIALTPLKKKIFKKKHNFLVLPNEENSLRPELSSPPHFRIQGG